MVNSDGSGSESAEALTAARRNAAHKCVHNHAKSNQLIGIGSGNTIVPVIERLAEMYHKEKSIANIICVPTSFQTRQLLIENGLPVGQLSEYPHLDICIDGADEIDDKLNCIKGGGACLTREKIIMSCAREFFVIADWRKRSPKLGDHYEHIPIEVVPLAYRPICERIRASEGGEPILRMAAKEAKFGPVVTDNGGYLVDWKFPKDRFKTNEDFFQLNGRLKMIPGIIETGLFLGNASKAYIGNADGSIEVLDSSFSADAIKCICAANCV